MKVLVIGDGIVKAEEISKAAKKLNLKNLEIEMAQWISDKVELQGVRREIEKYGPSSEYLSDEIANKILDAEIILTHYAPIPGDLIRNCRRLKIIGVCRAGVENVDISACTNKGVLVFQVMGRNAEAVSDFTIGLLLAESRNIARSHMLLKQGIWLKPKEENIHDLRGRTIGIIGWGNIGRLVAKKISSFGVRILVSTRSIDKHFEEIKAVGAEPVALEKLFMESDYICIHVRLTEDTKGMIDERLISLMKPTSYIINTARAEIIDENALCKALIEKRIAGAALDVFWNEPLPKGHILTQLDNVTLTSHLAGTTIESLTRSPELLIEDINLLLSNKEPKWIVNQEVLSNFKMELQSSDLDQ